MPGYDLSRFVDPNAAAELNSMTCFICQDIFNNPVVTSCCSQTFCESCIKPWVESNHTCPSDHKPLKVEQLVPPPAVITNLLNTKRIKCSFVGKGCTEISTVENIDNHEASCVYDKELCKTCGFVSAAGHDCLKALLDYKQNLASIMDNLRKELDEANAQNRNHRSQVENYTKTIKDLTLDRSRQVDAKPGGANRVNTNKDLLVEARKYANNPIVDAHKTRKEIVDKAMEVVKEAITAKGDRIYDVARFIKEFMDSNFMGDWNVYLVYNNIGFVYHNIIADGFIEIKFGKAVVCVYKTFDSLGFNRLVSFIKAGVIRGFVVTKSGFEDAATREIEKVALARLKKCADMNEFTDKVTADLINTYGGVWHCFIYKANFGFYCVRSDKGRFCLLSSADVKILIFQ